jgi:hypothetical protein
LARLVEILLFCRVTIFITDRMKKQVFITIMVVFSGIQILAQDRHFSWTYESTTLPRGGIDIEPWVTYSTGKDNFYKRYDSRIEFETGLTDRIQTSLYLNSSHSSFASVDSLENINGISHKSGFSFSNEWKFNLLNPSTSPVGLGLYAEFGFASDEIELEFKLIVDKKTPKSILSYNLVCENEFEYEYEDKGNESEIETEKEFVVENDLAYMYLLKPNFGLGLEARNHNVFVDGEMEHSAVFLGPTMFFSNGKFFAILNIMPQLGSLKSSGLDLEEYEKVSGRIIIGISL